MPLRGEQSEPNRRPWPQESAILTEDGNTIEGNDITPELIKKLRSEGRNPMWYLRKNWLEESYGLRGSDARNSEAMIDNDQPEIDDATITRIAGEEGIVALMQESIRELKKDKVLLTEQLKIKDEQIRETTERWKESNYISQGLNQRLEAMEKRFDLNTRVLQEASVRTPDPVATSTSENPTESEPAPDSVAHRQGSRKITSKSKSPAVRKTTPAARPPKKQPQPRWYEMPTFKRFLSRNK